MQYDIPLNVRQYVEARMPEKRRLHVEGVVREAERLARLHGADSEKAAIAAFCHDMARGMPAEEMRHLVAVWDLPAEIAEHPETGHGPLAAAMLFHDLGIRDAELLDAVANHTTGRAGMSRLEQVVYLADAIEPTRAYPGVERLRELAATDLSAACLSAMEGTVAHVRALDLPLDKRTLEAMEWLESQTHKQGPEKGKPMNNKEVALKAAKILSNKKAADLVVIDIAEKSSFADYLVIATGGSERQIGTLSNEVLDQFAIDGVFPKNTEGKRGSGWILLDYGDILVNIFSVEQRSRYNLEKIWGDGIFLPVED